MKKTTFSLFAVSIIWLTSCSNQGNNRAEKKAAASQDSTNKEVWAELVESKTVLIKPDGFQDDYWNSVNKKMDRHELFNTIVEAVLNGKQKAYSILTDSALTLDEVKAVVDLNGAKSEGNGEKKINSDDLSAIRMREKWVFDKEKFQLEKHVTRIDLLYKKVDENGEYLGDKALFYVNLNN
jgi:hypothetical protein